MMVNIDRIEIEMANKALSTAEFLELAQVPRGTWYTVRRTGKTGTATVGRIARALNVPVTEILIKSEVIT